MAGRATALIAAPAAGAPLDDRRRRCCACIGLGANLGDTAAALRAAFAALSSLPHTRLTARSSIYRSVPIEAAGPDYLNAVAQINTGLSALELLAHLQTIERQHGRERPFRNAPRTLDLDLLLYGDDVIDTPELTVPHPRMHQRAFVLVPLAELAPDLEIPGLGPVAQLLHGVADQAIVRIAEAPSSRRNAARATSAAPVINPVETHKPRRAP